MSTPTIRLTEVHLDAGAEDAVLDVLRSGQLAQGPKVEAFERAFAELINVRQSIAMSSGTSALVASMQSLNLEPGDEVITSPFTFAATLNAILEAGATARLVDVCPDDFTIDVRAVEDAIGPHTRAVVPIHIYGYPADMTALTRVLERRNQIAIIEDAAQAHIASIDGRYVGSFGLGVFSFYATKNVTTGEGGIVTTNDELLADRLRLLRNQGMRRRYEYELPGHNYRMTELQAAIGLSQLTRIHELTSRRRINAEKLRAGLSDIEGVAVPVEAPGRSHVYHQFTVRFARSAGLDRDRIAELLARDGVESAVYYPRLCHDYPCYERLSTVQPSDLSTARKLTGEVLSLPVHPWLSDADINRVIETVRGAVRAIREAEDPVR